MSTKTEQPSKFRPGTYGPMTTGPGMTEISIENGRIVIDDKQGMRVTLDNDASRFMEGFLKNYTAEMEKFYRDK